MLKENNFCKNLLNFGIVIGIIFFIFPPLLFVFIFVIIFLLFFLKLDLDIILRKIGVFECLGLNKNTKTNIIKNGNIDFNETRKILKKIKYKHNSNNSKIKKQNYKPTTNHNKYNKKSNYTFEKKTEEEKFYNSISDLLNEGKNKQIGKSKKIDKLKNVVKDKKIDKKYKKLISSKKYIYNGGKSIWDDYVSVIDIMNKK